MALAPGLQSQNKIRLEPLISNHGAADSVVPTSVKFPESFAKEQRIEDHCNADPCVAGSDRSGFGPKQGDDRLAITAPRQAGAAVAASFTSASISG